MTEYLLVLTYTFFFIFIIKKTPFFISSGISFRTLGGLFILKIISGIVLSLIYTYYYADRSTADVFKYFDDSKIMYDALFNKPVDFFKMLTGYQNDSPYFDHYYKAMNNWYRVYESNLYNESHTIIRINAVMRIFSFGFYNVHTVFMCFLSFTGLTALFKTASKYIPGKEMELVFGIFLLPSVLFWGSGVLKEGLLFFGLGMLIYYFFKMLKQFSLLSLLWVLISLVLIYYTKLYVLAIAVPVLLGHLITVKSGNRYAFIKFAFVLSIFILTGISIKYIFPGFDLLDILATKQHDFIGLAKFMNSGSLIDIPLLNPDLSSFIINAPQAFFTTFFRPFIFEADSIFVLMAALENLIILLITIIAVVFAKKSVFSESIFWACFFSVVLMFTLTGLITPVLGAIVRYKIPALPFLMIMLILIIDKDKMIKKIPFLKFLNKKP
jgi:hypothetical protein